MSLARLTGLVVLVLLGLALGGVALLVAVCRRRSRTRLAPTSHGSRTHPESESAYWLRHRAELPKTIETHAPVADVIDIERQERRRVASDRLELAALAEASERLTRESVPAAPALFVPRHPLGWVLVLVRGRWCAASPTDVVDRWDSATLGWVRVSDESLRREAAAAAAGVA